MEVMSSGVKGMPAYPGTSTIQPESITTRSKTSPELAVTVAIQYPIPASGATRSTDDQRRGRRIFGVITVQPNGSELTGADPHAGKYSAREVATSGAASGAAWSWARLSRRLPTASHALPRWRSFRLTCRRRRRAAVRRTMTAAITAAQPTVFPTATTMSSRRPKKKLSPPSRGTNWSAKRAGAKNQMGTF
jgi:hypothetical protein